MELFVVLIEGESGAFALLHLGNLIDYLGESKFGIRGTNISALTYLGNLLQELLIQSRNHHLTLLVLDKFATHLDRCALWRAYTYGKYANTSTEIAFGSNL